LKMSAMTDPATAPCLQKTCLAVPSSGHPHLDWSIRWPERVDTAPGRPTLEISKCEEPIFAQYPPKNLMVSNTEKPLMLLQIY